MTDEDRKAFEAIVSGPPYERCVQRYPDDASHHAWPRGYREYAVQFAYDVCKEMLAHRDKQVKELVEAVERAEDSQSRTEHYNEFLGDAAELAAKLKEQP